MKRRTLPGAGSLGLGAAAKEVTKNIGVLSDGTLSVKLYAAGELVAGEGRRGDPGALSGRLKRGVT